MRPGQEQRDLCWGDLELKTNADGLRYLAPVVRKLDSAIHRINRYPEDKYYDIQLRYPVDSNLSSG